jgi:hypothetical protein
MEEREDGMNQADDLVYIATKSVAGTSVVLCTVTASDVPAPICRLMTNQVRPAVDNYIYTHSQETYNQESSA